MIFCSAAKVNCDDPCCFIFGSAGLESWPRDWPRAGRDVWCFDVGWAGARRRPRLVSAQSRSSARAEQALHHNLGKVNPAEPVGHARDQRPAVNRHEFPPPNERETVSRPRARARAL